MEQILATQKISDDWTNFDVVVVDEAQDLCAEFCKFLQILYWAKLKQSKLLQIVMLGCQRQVLYGFRSEATANVRYMQLAPHIFDQLKWGPIVCFYESQRLTPNIAQFVNFLWGDDQIIGCNHRINNLPVQYIVDYSAFLFVCHEINKANGHNMFQVKQLPANADWLSQKLIDETSAKFKKIGLHDQEMKLEKQNVYGFADGFHYDGALIELKFTNQLTNNNLIQTMMYHVMQTKSKQTYCYLYNYKCDKILKLECENPDKFFNTVLSEHKRLPSTESNLEFLSRMTGKEPENVKSKYLKDECKVEKAPNHLQPFIDANAHKRTLPVILESVCKKSHRRSPCIDLTADDDNEEGAKILNEKITIMWPQNNTAQFEGYFYIVVQGFENEWPKVVALYSEGNFFPCQVLLKLTRLPHVVPLILEIHLNAVYYIHVAMLLSLLFVTTTSQYVYKHDE